MGKQRARLVLELVEEHFDDVSRSVFGDAEIGVGTNIISLLPYLIYRCISLSWSIQRR